MQPSKVITAPVMCIWASMQHSIRPIQPLCQPTNHFRTAPLVLYNAHFSLISYKSN